MNPPLSNLSDFEFILEDIAANDEPTLRPKELAIREQFEKVVQRLMDWSETQSHNSADDAVAPRNKEAIDKRMVLHGIDSLAFVTLANDYYALLKKLRGSLADSKGNVKSRLKAILDNVEI